MALLAEAVTLRFQLPEDCAVGISHFNECLGYYA